MPRTELLTRPTLRRTQKFNKSNNLVGVTKQSQFVPLNGKLQTLFFNTKSCQVRQFESENKKLKKINRKLFRDIFGHNYFVFLVLSFHASTYCGFKFKVCWDCTFSFRGEPCSVSGYQREYNCLYKRTCSNKVH